MHIKTDLCLQEALMCVHCAFLVIHCIFMDITLILQYICEIGIAKSNCLNVMF